MVRSVSLAVGLLSFLATTGCGNNPGNPGNNPEKAPEATPGAKSPFSVVAELKWDDTVDGPHERARLDGVAKMAALEETYLPGLRAAHPSKDKAAAVDLRQDFKSAQIVAFSPTAPLLALGDNQDIVVWDLQEKTVKQVVPLPADRQGGLFFSPDGRWLVTHSGSGDARIHVRIWDVVNGRDALNFESLRPEISGLGYSADAKTLWTTTWVWTNDDLSAKLVLQHRDPETGKVLKEVSPMETAEPPVRFSFSPAGDKMAGTTAHIGPEAFVFRTNDGALLRRHLLPNMLGKCTFSPDGWRVAITPWSQNRRGPDCFDCFDWDLKTDSFRKVAVCSRDNPSVAYSPDGKRLYLSGEKGIQCWDVEARKLVAIDDVAVPDGDFKFSPGGRLLCVLDRLYDSNGAFAKKPK